jgi:hypothetical protein
VSSFWRSVVASVRDRLFATIRPLCCFPGSSRTHFHGTLHLAQPIVWNSCRRSPMTTARFRTILYPAAGFAAKCSRNASRGRAITSASCSAAFGQEQAMGWVYQLEQRGSATWVLILFETSQRPPSDVAVKEHHSAFCRGRRTLGPAIKNGKELSPTQLHRKSSLRTGTRANDRPYLADTVKVNTAKTANTKPATSTNTVWNGCAWKWLSPDLLKCSRVLMTNLQRRSGSKQFVDLWPAFPYLN